MARCFFEVRPACPGNSAACPFPLRVESLALDFTELGRYLAERKWRKKTEKHHTLLAPPHPLPSPPLSSPPLQTSPPSLHPHPPLAPSTYCHHCNRCHHRPQPSPWSSLQSLPSSTGAQLTLVRWFFCVIRSQICCVYAQESLSAVGRKASDTTADIWRSASGERKRKEEKHHTLIPSSPHPPLTSPLLT